MLFRSGLQQQRRAALGLQGQGMAAAQRGLLGHFQPGQTEGQQQVGFRHPQAEGLGVEAVFGSLFGLAGGQGQAEQAKVSRNRQTGFCEGRPVVLGCRCWAWT